MYDLNEFGKIPVDYDSPINIVVNRITEEIAKKTEDSVMQAVFNAGFDIDKDKFVSILQGDKQRYDSAYRSGYAHGYETREDEIIRCKDCKYWDRDADGFHKKCKMFHTLGSSADWFCADGQREA